jgi:hypothetical protein
MRRSALRVCGWIGALASLVGCHKPPPLPPPMAQAQLAERRPDRSEAIREYQRIIELCGSGQAPASLRQKDDCGLAAFRLAQQLEQLEQFAEAADAYQQVEKLSHDPTKVARSLLRAAEIYADRLSQPGPAVELCQRILSSHPAEVAAEDALRAMVRWRRADPTLLPELDALAKKQSQHIPLASFAWLLSAQLAEEQGTVPDAVRRYDELARRYPKGPLLDDALIAAAKLLARTEALRRGGRAAGATTADLHLGAAGRALQPVLAVGGRAFARADLPRRPAPARPRDSGPRRLPQAPAHQPPRRRCPASTSRSLPPPPQPAHRRRPHRVLPLPRPTLQTIPRHQPAPKSRRPIPSLGLPGAVNQLNSPG